MSFVYEWISLRPGQNCSFFTQVGTYQSSFSFFPCKVNIERYEISCLFLDTTYLLDKSLWAEVSGCLMLTSEFQTSLKTLGKQNFLAGIIKGVVDSD